MIKKFEEHSNIKIVKSSDLDVNWSAEYKTNKGRGYLPYEVISGQYVVIPEKKFAAYKRFEWLRTDSVDELNRKKSEILQLEREFQEFKKSISK